MNGLHFSFFITDLLQHFGETLHYILAINNLNKFFNRIAVTGNIGPAKDTTVSLLASQERAPNRRLPILTRLLPEAIASL